jgi:hypothetical protein
VTPTITPYTSGTFTDNLDGTVTDSATGLMWEKKVGTVGNPVGIDIHDVNREFTWTSTGNGPDGGAFTIFLATLNTPPCFAGHCDWRLPSEEGHNPSTPSGPKEFESIFLPSCPVGSTPCIDPIFGPTATINGGYWSATDYYGNSNYSYLALFYNGVVDAIPNGNAQWVRAVRNTP